jgi:hypothetical protein
MSFALRRLATDPFPDLAHTAYLCHRNMVASHIMTEDQAKAMLLASTGSTIASSDASETIRRAFEAAKGSRP